MFGIDIHSIPLSAWVVTYISCYYYYIYQILVLLLTYLSTLYTVTHLLDPVLNIIIIIILLDQ